MTRKTSKDNSGWLKTASPMDNVSEKCASLSDDFHAVQDTEKRQRQLRFTHGYLRTLMDVDLFAGADLAYMRDRLMNAVD